MSFGPSDKYFDPPDPPDPCCEMADGDDWHDSAACLAAQAEDAAEVRADREREEGRPW